MKIKSGMRVVVIVFLVGSFLLTSCAEAGTPVLDSTLEASQPPVLTATPSSTATNTPEPGPSAASLPEGWAGRIDRIESVTGMDGAERTVAIEKSDDPDKESRLRVLQWDAGAGEWVKYAPQVGWVGWGEQNFEGMPVTSIWDENIQLPDRDTLAEPLHYADGTEIPMGWMGSIFSSGDHSDSGPRMEYFQGYILKTAMTNSGFIGTKAGELAVYTGVPLPSGDWMIYVSVAINQNTDASPLVLTLESFSPEDFGGDYGLMHHPAEMTYAKLYAYLLQHQSELVGQPIIQGVDIGGNYDDVDATEFINVLKNGDVPVKKKGLLPIFFPWVVSEAWWNQIAGQ